jgi:hypothetical protein
MACKKRHPNVASLKRALVKAARHFPIDTVRKAIDEWPARLRASITAKGGHFENLLGLFMLHTSTSQLAKGYQYIINTVSVFDFQTSDSIYEITTYCSNKTMVRRKGIMKT